jgi:ABC-type dipeptide/oligopeptide/nickel transport system ATPase component
MSEQTLVDVQDLVIEFDTPKGRVRVVDGVSFSVSPGEVLGILGESGSGKTMSTQAILGLIGGYPGVMGGQINLYNQGVTYELLKELPSFISERRGQPEKNERAWRKYRYAQMKKLWGRAITSIFQNPRRSLDPLMTVGQQVKESIQARESHKDTSERLSEQAQTEEALEWLAKVQMVDPARVYHSYPHELSGGMCQRAMIAVALACKPSILVADEPTTGLDATVRAQIVHLLQDLIKAEQCAMLYITHDIREMLYLADRVIVMRHGKVLEQVSANDLKEHASERHEYTRILLDAAGMIGAHDE